MRNQRSCCYLRPSHCCSLRGSPLLFILLTAFLWMLRRPAHKSLVYAHPTSARELLNVAAFRDGTATGSTCCPGIWYQTLNPRGPRPRCKSETEPCHPTGAKRGRTQEGTPGLMGGEKHHHTVTPPLCPGRGKGFSPTLERRGRSRLAPRARGTPASWPAATAPLGPQRQRAFQGGNAAALWLICKCLRRLPPPIRDF